MFNSRCTFGVSLVLFLSHLSTEAAAATLQVPSEQPTLAAAISAAVPGDVIVLAPGTYAENSITINKANLTVTPR